MGIYLNPEPENFRRTLAGEIYVDKTMMIAEINRFIDRGENYSKRQNNFRIAH